jgi:hypothetical protein
MNTKRLCSLGILDININLYLYESHAFEMNLKLDAYNSVDDLQEIFQLLNSNLNSRKNISLVKKEEQKTINYFNYEKYITLDSDNCLINTLLYINKAYKNKTFIEFIIPEKLEFNEKNKYLKNLVDEILSKNYLFVVETDKRKNNFSKINFIIKIIDDLYDKIKITKKFEIISNNNTTSDELNYNLKEMEDFGKIFIKQFNYNFNKIDFFIIDLKEIRKILIKADDIYNFLFKIINNFPKLKIILIIDENIITQNSEKEEIISIKKYIDLCDIIFSFKKNLNSFLRFYYTTNKRDITEKNPSKIFFLLKRTKNNPNEIDLITKDFNKYRTNITRILILFDEFNSIQIYEQDMKNKNLPYNNIFRSFLTSEEMTEEKNNYLMTKANNLYHIFISGFLSRLVYNKPFDICFEAGNLLMKKTLNILSKNELDTKREKFNIKVKSNGYRFLQKMKSDLDKEKKFVLDCTNKEKSRQKEYNILTDSNCLGFLTRKYKFKTFEHPTLIDKVKILLKGKRSKTITNLNNKVENKDLKRKEKDDLNSDNIKKLLPFINNNEIKKYKKAKSSLNSNIEQNLKTIPYASHSRHSNFNILKKSIHSKNIIKNCLHNINKAENYNKFLFKMYFPHQNFRNYLSNNNL